MHEGEVVACHGERIAVRTDTGASIYLYGRRALGTVVPGDRVCWQDTKAAEPQIHHIVARKSVLGRQDRRGRIKPVAANLDLLVVVCAAVPALDAYLIDQYLVAAEEANIASLIVFNKVDLWQDDLSHWSAVYAGTPQVHCCALDAEALPPLRAALQGHCSVLVGQSGVGKSSLIGALLQRDLPVGPINRHGLGKHTTSTSQRFELDDDTSLIDSPGVREFRVDHLPVDAIRRSYHDIESFAMYCRFPNCQHRSEPGCAVHAAVRDGKVPAVRVENFLRLLDASAVHQAQTPRRKT